ncbi:MAG TPA: RluA family pseudouridine synthase [Planctomycetota bacterium]|nr:RluA family pseudouridine synthase [Planctomycetota bacterium]
MKHIEIIFEDQDLFVVNKPAPLVCHAAGHYQGDSLMARIRATYGEYYFIHRLDRETSGILVFGKNEKAIANLAKQWEKRVVKKIYRALVHGIFTESQGVLEHNMSSDYRPTTLLHNTMYESKYGKKARTKYNVLQVGEDISFIELFPETGRKHQLRFQLSISGHPIVGETLYQESGLPFLWEKLLLRPYPWIKNRTLALHAHSLTLYHPRTKERLTFFAPSPLWYWE